ncbi:sensor histidine kinase [Nonomuraea cavernae]|uniref:Anti-sigma regulatory factor n=1 Tax=Nonomuraea cavernae TaxID=2045107 RepID=A0A917YN94_9ACTN|nr:sensor histidine kinase [Nonomuraea cavernae]MCA2183695.1 sensor histidine kinase [Nonomuraea cavernae]GGO61087.1 anti-sigma regulatory factor [Nonomuraea cavernae]
MRQAEEGSNPAASDPASTLIHQALLYDGIETFAAAAARFCLDGLARGDRIMAVVTPPNIEALEDVLGADAARVELVNALEWYDAPGRTLDACGRYVNTHQLDHPRVRMLGEPVWRGRDRAQEAEWTRYESMLNAAFAGSPVWIMCTYDTRALPRHIVDDARRTHPELVTGHGTTVSPAYTEPSEFGHSRDLLPLPPPGQDYGTRHVFDADLRLLRQYVTAWAAAGELPAETADRLVIVVNEVAANAVEHGGGRGDILLWTEDDSICCDIRDAGRPDGEGLELFAGYLPPTSATARGYGLWVARQLCDLVEVRTGQAGTQVRLRLRRT